MLESQANKPSPWPRRVVILGMIWGISLLVLTTILEPTPENLTVNISILFSGLYTLGLFITRPIWFGLLSRWPVQSAALLGIFNAMVVETIFLIFEKIFEAEGVAAHPNLIIDLILTMPWYICMVITFVRVQCRQRFSTAIVLLLGGVYETGADGVVSQVVGILFGDSQLFSPIYWFFLGALAFWQFIVVYSSMLLPSAWLIQTLPPPTQPAPSAKRDALKPLIWLIPFSIYLLMLIIILSAFELA